ncbi:MAG: hypothetical protein J5634_04045 [Bacilli bacterium]|nr:hypothetical protein [Bacilli bacterium]
MAESKKSKLEFKIEKGRFFAILFAAFTIMMMLYDWLKFEAWGSSIKYGIFHSNMFDANACLGLAKVFTIIGLVVGILYIIALVINFEKLVPGLKKFKFGFYRLFGLVYYGLICLAGLFYIIGCISESGVVPTFSGIVLFIMMIFAVLKYAVPAMFKVVEKKFTFTIE